MEVGVGCDERLELEKAAVAVEQQLDTLADEKLPTLAMTLDVALATAAEIGIE
jgi:hypothetical protein